MPNLRYSITALNNSSKESDFKNGTPLIYIQSKEILNTNAPVPECDGGYVQIDWYYQIWIDNQLVYEEYLYSTTECLTGGGGGGGGSTATFVTTNVDFEVYRLLTYSENWVIKALFKLQGYAFENNSTANYFTSINHESTALFDYFPANSYPTYSLTHYEFSEINHVNELQGNKIATGGSTCRMYYPNWYAHYGVVRDNYYSKLKNWDAQYSLY